MKQRSKEQMKRYMRHWRGKKRRVAREIDEPARESHSPYPDQLGILFNEGQDKGAHERCNTPEGVEAGVSNTRARTYIPSGKRNILMVHPDRRRWRPVLVEHGNGHLFGLLESWGYERAPVPIEN